MIKTWYDIVHDQRIIDYVYRHVDNESLLVEELTDTQLTPFNIQMGVDAGISTSVHLMNRMIEINKVRADPDLKPFLPDFVAYYHPTNPAKDGRVADDWCFLTKKQMNSGKIVYAAPKGMTFLWGAFRGNFDGQVNLPEFSKFSLRLHREDGAILRKAYVHHRDDDFPAVIAMLNYVMEFDQNGKFLAQHNHSTTVAWFHRGNHFRINGPALMRFTRDRCMHFEFHHNPRRDADAFHKFRAQAKIDPVGNVFFLDPIDRLTFINEFA